MGWMCPRRKDQLRLARWGIAALPGRAKGYLPAIWIDDAAAAVVAALAAGSSGVYNIVEDEPLPRREVITAMAQAVGRRRLYPLPAGLMRVVGGVGAEVLGRSLRISNRRFKEATGWKPTVPDARIGWQRLAESQGKVAVAS